MGAALAAHEKRTPALLDWRETHCGERDDEGVSPSHFLFPPNKWLGIWRKLDYYKQKPYIAFSPTSTKFIGCVFIVRPVKCLPSKWPSQKGMIHMTTS